MAETLTIENTVEPTSIDNLSEEEQDSLKVGEAMEQEQQQLLAGKYKNAEELEKAHIELQKKLGQKENPKEEVEEVSEEAPEDEAPETNVLERLWTETQEGDQKVTKETIEELAKTDPRELAKMHLNYRAQNSPRDFTENDVKQLKSMAGGDEGYANMLEWANENLNEKEIEMFDAVMGQGNPLAAFFAVRSLAYRYQDAQGYEGRMVTGKPAKANTNVYRSQQELVTAMNDPRYDKDPAYRQDVMQKLSRSKNVSFG